MDSALVVALHMRLVMKITTFILASSLLTGCVIGDQGGGSGQNEGDILYGADDYGDPAVAMIRSVSQVQGFFQPSGFAGCTGTLISPNVVLTAGHCAAGFRFWTDVTFDRAPDLFAAKNSAGYIGATIFADPAYNGDPSLGHDVAVVLLDTPVSIAQVARGPLPAVGSSVTGVGFGANTFEVTGFGTKRIASFDVTAENDHEIVAGHDGNGTCHGDSGGPIFQNGQIVGVTSYGDTADCHNSSHFMRPDDSLDFIHRFAPNF